MGSIVRMPAADPAAGEAILERVPHLRLMERSVVEARTFLFDGHTIPFDPREA